MAKESRAFNHGSGEVAHFIDDVLEIATRVARKRHGKGTAWKPKPDQIAQVVDVNPTTLWRWGEGLSFPRQKWFQSLLALAEIPLHEQTKWLTRWQEVHNIWSAPPSAARGRVGDAAWSEPDPEASAVTGDHDAVGPEAWSHAARPAKQGLADGMEVRCDAAESSGSDPSQGRDPDVSVLTRSAEEQRPSLPTTGDDPQVPGRHGELTDSLEHAADELARMVHKQWDEEAARRGLDIPAPIPPRWVLTPRAVAGSPEVALGIPTHRTRFTPLPGAALATAEAAQSGGLDELVGLYAGVASGRIVLMGHYGSGKTSTAIMMLLDILDCRMGLAPTTRAETPVPVLLDARGWDPTRHALDDWFAAQLAAIYDFLLSPQYGRDAPGELVRRGRVALFLDGLDEMDQHLRAEALRQINRSQRTFRLVALTRIDDFADTTRTAQMHLHGALAVELLPVSDEHAVTYLSAYQRFPVQDGDELQQLIDHLLQHPEDLVSQAFDTPLALSLVSDDPHAIPALLVPGHFHTREQVEEVLLSRVVPAAYQPEVQPRPSAQQAEQWLGFLATRMDGNDLAWWQVHHWAPARERYAADILTGILLMSAIGALVFGPGRYTVTGHTGTFFGICYGAGLGALFGLVAAFVAELRDPRPRLDGITRAIRRRLPHTAFNPAIGLFVLVSMTMAVGNQSNYLFGFPSGLICGGTAGHAAARIRTTSSTRFWWHRLRPNGTDLLTALAIGMSIGLAYGLTKTTAFGISSGLITAFTFGFMTSMARPVSDSDTPPTPESRWRRDRNRSLIVGLTAGIPLGLALGFQNGRAHGPTAGVIATLGLGSIIAIGTMIAISDIWRTALAFAQLNARGRFPLHGMRFLTDARDRRVLRTVGPKFQFRHDRLHLALAETYSTPRAPSRNDDQPSA